ncbi:MAG: enolase C-terminal domain-like protein [Maricaulaceae bacterium]
MTEPDAPAYVCTPRSWPLAQPFRIARGVKTEAVTVWGRLDTAAGPVEAEVVPYARYSETAQSVLDAARAALARPRLEADLRGAAANLVATLRLKALAAREGRPPSAVIGAPVWRRPVSTALTISLDAPNAMAEAARAAEAFSLLKLKIGGPEDLAGVGAVRGARPDARLVVDANEGLQAHGLPDILRRLADLNVDLVEQPLPAGEDAMLADMDRPLPIGADESAHSVEDLATLKDRYDAVNVKLDKAGGPTAALAMAKAARAEGFKVMVGCMVGPSLAIAPAWSVVALADWVDLDGPLWLARDSEPGLTFDGPRLHPPPPALWA